MECFDTKSTHRLLNKVTKPYKYVQKEVIDTQSPNCWSNKLLAVLQQNVWISHLISPVNTRINNKCVFSLYKGNIGVTEQSLLKTKTVCGTVQRSSGYFFSKLHECFKSLLTLALLKTF